MKSRRLLAAAIAPIAATGLAMAGTTPAQAAAYGHYDASDGTRIRASYNLSSTIYGLGYPSHYSCWSIGVNYGQSVSGNTVWWYNHDYATGVTGWSSDTVYSAYTGAC